MPSSQPPPVVVIYGDEEFAKLRCLQQTLDELLPPAADRGMALAEYDAGRNEGELDFAAVMDDLNTRSFFADLRIVIVREADRFITAFRAGLERYLERPSDCGVLVLLARSFPKTTRLYKSAAAAGRLHECKALTGQNLVDFIVNEARRFEKRLDRPVAQRLIEQVGNDQGILVNEIEKLALYAASRPAISDADVTELVGQSREEKIFAVMDAAAGGRLPAALQLWHQTLATDPAAAFKAVAGMAFVLRRWLTAHEMAAAGEPVRAIAPRVMMWGRESELQALLRRLNAQKLKRILGDLAQLDAQAKTGLRSIDTGIEALLIAIARPAA
jgi:DNA polymerase-3 subunit delta